MNEIEKFSIPCAWCGKALNIYQIHIRKQDIDVVGGRFMESRSKRHDEFKKTVQNAKGNFILLNLCLLNKIIPVFCCTEDSLSFKEKGFEVLFWTCSTECSGLLKSALQDEINIFVKRVN